MLPFWKRSEPPAPCVVNDPRPPPSKSSYKMLEATKLASKMVKVYILDVSEATASPVVVTIIWSSIISFDSRMASL